MSPTKAAGRVDSSASAPQRLPECPATTTAPAAASGHSAIQPGKREETSTSTPTARRAMIPVQPSSARAAPKRGRCGSSGRCAPLILSSSGSVSASSDPAANSHIRAAVSK